MDLSPQYASILTGVTRLGQFGGSISTTLAGALREKVCLGILLNAIVWGHVKDYCKTLMFISIFFINLTLFIFTSFLLFLQNAESWQKILIITGSVHLFAVVIFTIFGSGKEQKWAQSGYEPITSNGSQKHNYGSTTTSSSSNQFLLNGAFISDKPS